MLQNAWIVTEGSCIHNEFQLDNVLILFFVGIDFNTNEVFSHGDTGI